MGLSKRIGAAVAALGILLAALASGCGDSPIVIGLAGPFEGKYSDLGVQGRNGAVLAVEGLNARGGIDGRPVELLLEDDGSTPQGAVAAGKTLREAGAAAIIGHFTSTQSLAAVPAANEAGSLLLSPTTSTPALSGKDDMFLRVMPASSKWARALARYARDKLRAGRILMVRDMDNSGYTVPFTKAFSDAFTADENTPTEVATIEFSSSERTDWAPVLDTLATGSFDSVLFACSASDTADLARHLHAEGLYLPLFMAPWAYTRELVALGGDSVEGIVSCMVFSGDTVEPGFIDFSKRYVDRFGFEPNFAAVFAYECVTVLASGLRATDGEAEGLKEAILAKGDYSGLLGRFHFDQYGDVNRPYFIVTVRDGELVSLEKASG